MLLRDAIIGEWVTYADESWLVAGWADAGGLVTLRRDYADPLGLRVAHRTLVVDGDQECAPGLPQEPPTLRKPTTPAESDP